MQFHNSSNGHVETVSRPFLWTLLFGCGYFAVKGVWTHALLAFFAAVLTSGLSWLIYPFFAPSIMKNHYLRNGWTLVDDEPEPSAAAPPLQDAEMRSSQAIAQPEFARRTRRIVRQPAPSSNSNWDVTFYAALGVCVLIVLGSFEHIVNQGRRAGESQQPVAKGSATVSEPSGKNVAHSLILKKRASDQAVFLGWVAQKAGFKCTGAKTFFQGFDADQAAYWNVRCTNGKEYGVQIAADAGGSTSVLECNLLEFLTKGKCFQKFDD